jgi:hypothetical protein
MGIGKKSSIRRIDFQRQLMDEGDFHFSRFVVLQNQRPPGTSRIRSRKVFMRGVKTSRESW